MFLWEKIYSDIITSLHVATRYGCYNTSNKVLLFEILPKNHMKWDKSATIVIQKAIYSLIAQKNHLINTTFAFFTSTDTKH